MFSTKCKEHLKDVKENGFQHMIGALIIAVKLQILVPILIVHAIVPCLFTKTASHMMKDILENR
jgi:hypothetical protein